MVSARSLSKRSTTILIALVLALGTGLLAFNYLTSVNKAAVNVPMRSVVVATQEIPVRTVVTPSMLAITTRAADAVDPDAESNVGAIAGQIALITIPSGSILSDSKVGRIGLGGLTVRIPAGQQAISIALDRVKGVADLVEAGDHVDVIAVTQSRGAGADISTAATILRNKVVVAMGSALETPTAAAANAAASPGPDATVETATLAVTPKEAKILALADLNATLRLALLSVKDQHSTESPEPFVLPTAPPQMRSAAAAAPQNRPQPTVSAAPKRVGPPIIDGDRLVN